MSLRGGHSGVSWGLEVPRSFDRTIVSRDVLPLDSNVSRYPFERVPNVSRRTFPDSNVSRRSFEGPECLEVSLGESRISQDTFLRTQTSRRVSSRDPRVSRTPSIFRGIRTSRGALSGVPCVSRCPFVGPRGSRGPRDSIEGASFFVETRTMRARERRSRQDRWPPRSQTFFGA